MSDPLSIVWLQSAKKVALGHSSVVWGPLCPCCMPRSCGSKSVRAGPTSSALAFTVLVTAAVPAGAREPTRADGIVRRTLEVNPADFRTGSSVTVAGHLLPPATNPVRPKEEDDHLKDNHLDQVHRRGSHLSGDRLQVSDHLEGGKLERYVKDEHLKTDHPGGPRNLGSRMNSTVQMDGKSVPGHTVASPQMVVECSWRTAIVLGLLLFVAMSPIGLKQGLRPFLVVLVYISCLTLVKILVKLTLRSGLPYPYTVTAAHVVCTALVASAFDLPRLEEALRVLPISLANSAALALSNTALAFSGVAFVSMLSCCTPASTCAVEILSRRRDAAWQTAVAVLIVCTGGMLCIKGEKEFSMLALGLTVLSSFCRSAKCIWQHDQLEMALSPYRMVAWSGIWSVVLMLPLVAYYEGTQGLRHFCFASNEARAAALSSTLVAVVLNMVQCSALQYLGPLIQHIIGNLQLIMAIVLASAWLHEQVSFLQWGGVVLLVLGTMVVKASPKPSVGSVNLTNIKLPAPDTQRASQGEATDTQRFPRPWLSPGMRLLVSAGANQRLSHHIPK